MLATPDTYVQCVCRDHKLKDLVNCKEAAGVLEDIGGGILNLPSSLIVLL